MRLFIHIFTKLLFISGIFIISTNNGFSQGSSKKSIFSPPWKAVPFERKAFIENKGQFDHLISEDKKNFLYCIDKGQQVFFYKNSYSFHFNSINISKAPLLGLFETEKQKEERTHNAKKNNQFVDIEWLNANSQVAIIANNKQTTQYAYLLNNTTENQQTIYCDGYSKIIYKNLYPNIDVEYVFHPQDGIKYNILLHPGADISQVKMKYSKNVKLSLKNGNIHIKTIVGDIIDHAPVTFYAENNQNIPSAFKVENNIVSFDISSIDPNKEVVIDPWVVVPSYTPTKAFDNGVDASGNIYIYGGGGGTWFTEKYAPTGGAPIWSLPNLLTASQYSNIYYGDMLVEGSGDFYLCQSVDNDNGAHVQKFSPTGAPIWTSAASPSAMLEYWRMALNCVTGKVIVAGGGINYNVNIAQIDAATGALSNVQALNAPDDISGLCVDETGKSYTHGAMTNKISFNDASNNPIATALSNYTQSEAANPYVGSNGYNMMVLAGTDFLFTSDGATLKKWDRNTYAIISSVVIPGGQPNMGSGIIADQCNNLFVGASNGVYRFDFDIVQKEYKATTTAVYDIAFASNGDIAAVGDGFLETLTFNREACSNVEIEITTDPCNAEINTVKVIPGQGVLPFTFLWDDGNTDSVRTNLSLGDHIVSIKDAACTSSFIIDTVTIGGSVSSMSITKINPVCTYSSDGQITISLLSNQEITGITWTPTVTNVLLNDSTSQATGLTTGTYNCFITSSLGCSFDTTITLASQFSNPSSDFFDAQACQNQAIQFDENSSSNVGAINSWTWDFGDNTATSNSQNPTHTYTSGGTFTTTLIVSTTSGCTDTVEKETIVHPIPTVEFFADNICEGNIAYFTDASTIEAPSIIQYWQWDFGDNTPIRNNQNTNHVYASTGTYNVELVVSSNFGCKDSVTKTITVNPNPIITFTASDTVGCSPLCVDFQSNVILSGGSIVAYLWTYGDLDAFDNTENGSYCYNNTTGNTPTPQPLLFDVSLTVTTDGGCVNIAEKQNYITVFPNPVANFTATPQTESIINPVIEIVDLSLNANTWLWNFGDDSTSTTQNPGQHIYGDTGTFLISLNNTNQYLCTDSAFQTVIIEPDWAFYVPNAFTPNGDGKNETFGGQGYGVLEYEMFIYDRWGNLLFATDSMDKPWNGKANFGSNVAQMDVFVYKINIRDIKRKKHEFTGTVTLVR